jgi:hypothetical protein
MAATSKAPVATSVLTFNPNLILSSTDSPQFCLVSVIFASRLRVQRFSPRSESSNTESERIPPGLANDAPIAEQLLRNAAVPPKSELSPCQGAATCLILALIIATSREPRKITAAAISDVGLAGKAERCSSDFLRRNYVSVGSVAEGRS